MAESEATTEPQAYRYKRVHLNIPIDLRFHTPMNTNQTSPAIRGLLTEMGPGGLYVLLGTAYYGGTRFEVVVEFDGVPIKFHAIVKRVKWFSTVPGLTYGHAMQIVQIEHDSLLQIAAYLTNMLGGDGSIIMRRAA
jgi:hypothetical protein